MQINNNPSVQSFGMAMRIRPEAASALRGMSEESLAKLAKIGEELKDTVHYHLVITEGGKPIVASNFANAYQAPFTPQFLDLTSQLKIDTRWAGTEVSGRKVNDPDTLYFYRKSGDNFCSSFVEQLKAADSDLDKAVVMVKNLEADAVYKAQKEAEEAAKQARVNGAVDELMSKFGVDFGD